MKKPSLESNKIEELWLGQSTDLLKELHILTRDGKLNQDSRRKLKQVYHLCQLIEPYLENLFKKNPNPTIVDIGCGKSYLGFMLYDLFLRHKDSGQIIGIEIREDLQKKSQQLAQKSGFQRMSFLVQNTQEMKLPVKPDFVCALHACDTATDDAILQAIEAEAQVIAVVPCCQAEVSRLLEQIEKNSLWEYPIHRREFGSHLTNVIRCLVLKSLGYQVTVTELVGWEHSLKNEIILAEKTHSENKIAQQRLQQLLTQIPIKPKLIQKVPGRFSEL